MTLVVPNPNIVLQAGTDKLGHMLNRLKNALVATGLWTVTGSGDGGSLVQNQGQTAGEGGSFDVFASNQNPVYGGTYTEWLNNIGNQARNLSRPYAWFQVKEKGSTRTLQFKRAAAGWGSDGSYADTFAMRIAPGGVKSTGATPTMAPVPNTNTAQWLLSGSDPSTSFSTSSTFWSGAMRWWTQTSDVVMQILVSTDARAKGVCPFAVVLGDRTRNAMVGGMFYESLLDSADSDPHPYIFKCGDMSAVPHQVCFGRVLGEDQGPFYYINSGAYQTSVYGENCDRWNFEIMSSNNIEAGSGYWLRWPGAAPHPVNAAGKWRPFSPRVRAMGGKYVGRSEHLLSNLGSRDYPTTYGLATASPRLAVGQLLFPWPQNVVPLLGV